MITGKQVNDGIKNGTIRFITDPNMGSGTVCAIGDYWFYFGGETAENESPSEYLKHVPIEDIVGEVLSTLNDFQKNEETADEYAYYEAFLQEAAAKNQNRSQKASKKCFVICYKAAYTRDTQVFLGDPNEEEPLSDAWTDTTSAQVLVGCFHADSKEMAIDMAAKLEGCHPGALEVITAYEEGNQNV